MDPVDVEKEDIEELKMNLDLLSYPAQTLIVRHLQSSSDDLLNLGKVFPGMAEVADLTKTTWMFEKIFPSLVSYLTKADSLRCRLVCRTWMQRVDEVLHKAGLTEPDYGEPLRSLSPLPQHWSENAFGLLSCWFQKSDTISSFMGKMADHSGNPFPSRCVQINDQNDPQYWQEVTQFLERFGSEIWKLRMGCYRSFLRTTVIIRNILALVPNLKMLSLEYNDTDLPDQTEEEIEEARQDLEHTPFPPLPNLTFLDWSFCSEFYNAALPQYSDHLVHINFMDEEFLGNYDSRTHGSFPNLKTLVVDVQDEDELWKLLGFTSLLKSVTTRSDNFIPHLTYFQVFHHFAGTLESINIEYAEEDEPWEFPQEENDGQLVNEILEFPVLKCVRFENPNPMESFDTLLCLKPGPSSLQIQTFTDDWTDEFRDYQQPLFEVMAGERVQIHGYLERMYESKVWEMMPQLQTFDVKAYNPMDHAVGDVYKRCEWKGDDKNGIEDQVEE